ncbi:type II toxin-antitoxin system mRNA interferase toxin, RelE/StbE family [uncultured Cloacibacillus sp.]|jgi:mRNA interferase YafQ|uniref:type II toxin-antitoxin system YafQ family toxin n=1 Tax=uncultured Cloacibacillus sp. TaxID=889794 RepID=UPI0027D9AD3F|nr:type II toxin-antitoxin system mRNA interferase toxin, RelE/StbE family [uncultured Cloacibacillus sp.]
MSKYTVKYTSRFKKEAKRAEKQGKNMALLKTTAALLSSGESLPPKFKDHALTGNWEGYRECHLSPDWLLIYLIENDVLVLTLTRTGSHAEIFNK